MNRNAHETVNAKPVKSFFVDMLTRDIELVDAILDLLDNCVDGILRLRSNHTGQTPYEGFEAEIRFDEHSFSITDNCGGIPWDSHDYAFRMGIDIQDRDNDIPTVGVYGIGMKRAIFKLGKQCLISTKNGKDQYEIEISPNWIEDQNDWDLPVSHISNFGGQEDGTEIVVGDLNPNIVEQFSDSNQVFASELVHRIETHYAFIMAKGFKVKVNDVYVAQRPTKLVFVKTEDAPHIAVRPFIYRSEIDGVSIFLSVGFTTPIPSQEEIDDDMEDMRYSSMDAGWTVICNDRAVLYCDRTELTGWGEAGVPRYHNQFIAISGIVEFRSNDASKLPTTTTKRGVDASSSLYLQTKNKMREGMKMFTDFTNKWKGKGADTKRHMDIGEPLSLDQTKAMVATLKMNEVRTGLKGEQYKPNLPMPEQEPTSLKRISYSKKKVDIETIQSYLFGKKEMSASRVGEECFDLILKEAQL